MSIYRTLRQAELLRDHSNYSLRFHRTMREAGWTPAYRDHRPAQYFWITYVAILGALMLALI
jgi:hypothetical protein